MLVEGSSVAVFGCGAIGLGVINTAASTGASRVIAIDVNNDKESWAKNFGATEFINPLALKGGQKIQDYLVEITDGGLDFTFDCTGNVTDSYKITVPTRNLTKLGDSRLMLCDPLSRLVTKDGVSLL